MPTIHIGYVGIMLYGAFHTPGKTKKRRFSGAWQKKFALSGNAAISNNIAELVAFAFFIYYILQRYAVEIFVYDF